MPEEYTDIRLWERDCESARIALREADNELDRARALLSDAKDAQHAIDALDRGGMGDLVTQRERLDVERALEAALWRHKEEQAVANRARLAYYEMLDRKPGAAAECEAEKARRAQDNLARVKTFLASRDKA